MKIYIIIILALALVNMPFSGFAPVFATSSASARTTGSSPSYWAEREIGLAREAGLVTASAMINYTAEITREQFCGLLIKLYEKLTGDTAEMGRYAFKDTINPEVLKAYKLGFVNGVSADEFAPHSSITRQEICVMIVRCIDKAVVGADIARYKNNSFADSNKIADWAKSSVNYAFDHGIMTGVSQDTIAPLDSVTCEQAILLVYRAFQGNYTVRTAPFEFADGHADTITAAMEKDQDLYHNNLHVDFERLKEYKSPVQVFTVWCADKYVKNAFEYANSAIDFFESELAKHSNIIELARSLEDMERIAKDNKISAILALEGGEPLAGKISNIDHFYSRGVRLITLTWNRENELGYGASANSDKGLKPFGVDCVKRMNELGIIIDVSHLNEAGFWDVDKLSVRPYMASHSNAYTLTPHARNLKDAQITAIVEKGGIIGINLYPGFLTSSGAADINSIMSHIDYFIKLGAANNIGLGCDFDGFSTMPVGFFGVSSLKMLSGEIADRIDESVSSKIMSDNYYDFFKRFF